MRKNLRRSPSRGFRVYELVIAIVVTFALCCLAVAITSRSDRVPYLIFLAPGAQVILLLIILILKWLLRDKPDPHSDTNRVRSKKSNEARDH
jgi:hypothetical protein